MENPKQDQVLSCSSYSIEQLVKDAVRVLADNRLEPEGFTKPAPHLYPHQWSWDSAFISIGLSYQDLDRALAELVTLFKGQWKDGRVPHILFSPRSGDYFPGPEYWNCTGVSNLPPAKPLSSGLIQPPVHALAAWNIWRVAELEDRVDQYREPLNQLFDKLLSWHRYLAEKRDPDGMGLISIYHPWESGLDNSPRWDKVLSKIEPGDMPEFKRRDTSHVKNSDERPTDEEYKKYMWLVELLKQSAYDDAELHRTYPFVVKDVLMSAIFNLSNHALIQLGEALGRSTSDLDYLQSLARKTKESILENCLDKETGMTYDLDMGDHASQIKVSTCAALSGLLVSGWDAELTRAGRDLLVSERFCGNKMLRYAVIPSTVPDTVGFKARSYWRGPSWPVLNWLFSYALARHGFSKESEDLKKANLAMLAKEGACFGEYFCLTTGEPLGSLNQSWTAAVVLDWLSDRSLLKSI